MTAEQNLLSKIYYQYFRDLMDIQDYIIQNPIYAETYYDGLNQMFHLIHPTSSIVPIIHSNYVHKIHNQFPLVKQSKMTKKKLIRKVKIDQKGLIQVDQNSEKQLEHVDMLLEIIQTDEIKDNIYKIAFVNDDWQLKWVYFKTLNDAIKIRDFCLFNASQNNLNYNLTGFITFLAKRFKEIRIKQVKQCIHKTSVEMQKLIQHEQELQISLSICEQLDSFDEKQYIIELVHQYLDTLLNIQIDKINDEVIEEDIQISQISILQLSDFQKSIYY